MSHGAFVVDARDGGEDSESEEEEVVTSSGGGRVWLVAAGNEGSKWEGWRARGVVAISVEDIDLRTFASRTEMHRRIVEIRGGDTNPTNDSKACWDFLHVMQPGDEVFVKHGRRRLLGYGRVTGDYRFVDQDRYCHERDVEWLPIAEAKMPEGADPLVLKTLTNVTPYEDLVAMLRSVACLPAEAPSALRPAPARTFLVTWNPERWDWPELEASAAALARGEELPADKWNTGGRQDLRQGDRFFLLRQGSAPRGIIGSGRILGPPVEQAHWEEARAAAGETTRSAPIAYDTLLPRERVLTVEALKAAGLEGVRWNPQSSGTQVPPQFVAQVEAAWQAHLEGRTVAAADVVRAVEPYGLDDLEAEGCFVPRARIEGIVERLRRKKNLILQGPPGTGKTWLAKRLGDLLVGHRQSGRVRVVQFHPNVSYEDFVRGYRPGSDGKLRIVDGLFMEAVKAAKARPELPMVVVIEEINRGNPAQVFGELLTLLESSKRNLESAIELTYAGPDEGQGELRHAVHLPDNLYVIGTMNTADRSIAMVDIAFRRRFTFENLRPALDEAWLTFVAERGMPRDFALRIRNAVDSLNDTIRSSKTLGPDYCLGHSFFTPHDRLEDGSAQYWMDGVVEAEVSPLIYEYWFDDHPGAARALALLRDALR
jgi:MoxR-like ATPase